jgi:hypothetical protein
MRPASYRLTRMASKVGAFVCFFPFGEEKLVAPLIAIPNVEKANRRQEKGKKLS